MRQLFLLLALAPVALPAAVDVYRWTDANGTTHYSDRPQPGAERVTVQVQQPASGQRNDPAPAADFAAGDERPEAFTRYQSLTITSPAQEQTLWNIEGQLDVAAAVQPALQPGHALRFSLDGRTVTAEPGSTRTRFPEVFRGEHSLAVAVVDGEGRTLASSPAIRFFVRQTALPNPPAPARP